MNHLHDTVVLQQVLQLKHDVIADLQCVKQVTLASHSNLRNAAALLLQLISSQHAFLNMQPFALRALGSNRHSCVHAFILGSEVDIWMTGIELVMCATCA